MLGLDTKWWGEVLARRDRIARAGLGPLLILFSVMLGFSDPTPSGSGWNWERWANGRLEGAPVARAVVLEPFAKEEPTAPFSAQWTAWMRVDRPGRFEFVVEADDEVELLVGEERLLQVVGKRKRTTHKATVRLTEPIVPLTLRLVDHGGGKYLRLFLNELDGPHGWSPVPWPREITWPTRELAEAALGGSRAMQRATVFSFFLVFLTLGVALTVHRHGLPFGLRLPSRRTVAIAATIALAALAARLHGLGDADIYWDEGAYLKAGMHYVRNLELGDFAPQSFHWNKEHPPVAKWLYGGAEWLGGMWGAKLFAAILQAMSCLLVFAIGRRYGSLTIGASAGMLLALMPYFVGHGRAIGLESPLVFFTCLSAWLLMRACERDSWPLHAAWGFTSILGVGSRATGVWFAPIAPLVCGVALARGGRRVLPMAGAFAGAAAGVLLIYAGWPWIWGDPLGQLAITYSHWATYVPKEFFLGVQRVLPVWYYGFAFLAASPTLLLALALVWLGFAVRRRSVLDWLILGWLIFPFGQSLSPMRQDGARYVIQAFPALALAAAAGLERAVEKLGSRPLTVAAHGALALYVAVAMLWVHPYQLDYCSEWTGGPASVVARRWLEIPYWGEGYRELFAALERVAPPGAKVYIGPRRHDDLPALRGDLVPVPLESADYALLGFFQYPAEPRDFTRIYEARAGGAAIGAVYLRDDLRP